MEPGPLELGLVPLALPRLEPELGPLGLVLEPMGPEPLVLELELQVVVPVKDFLPHSKARFELQQVVLTTYTCLNAFYCSHAIG